MTGDEKKLAFNPFGTGLAEPRLTPDQMATAAANIRGCGYVPAHSPTPFQLVHTREGGHLLLDSLGDSIAALAAFTGDHPAEEQLANARLFAAAPLLLAAAKIGRQSVAEDRRLTIEGASYLEPETLAPDLATLDPEAAAYVAQLDAQLATIDAAIAVAEPKA